MDERLGRSPRTAEPDAMLERTSSLGLAHEDRVLAGYLERLGGDGQGVVSFADEEWSTLDDLRAAHDRTVAALRDGAALVYQGVLFDGRFLGRPDFLVDDAALARADGKPGEVSDAGPTPLVTVVDSKLARHAKVTALLQLAAYADQLQGAGVPVAPHLRLVHGDGSVSEHALADVLPVYRERRARLERVVDAHLTDDAPVVWGDERYSACGRCARCTSHVVEHRDLLLVAGLRTTQRARLREAGITTIDDLAASTGPVEGVPDRVLSGLREQAALQVAQDSRPALPGGRPDVRATLVGKDALSTLPAPDPGDVFFDFEGDPLWTAPGSSDWGLEYLFGVVEAPTSPDAEPVFRAFWAHDRAQEKQALLDFLAYLRDRRAEFPGMHVYHYAPYEKTALGRLVGRHGVGEEQLDDLLRHGVLVDLYATVRQSVRVSQPSYSIKKLEPLYMGDDLRNADLDNAADSITEYARACEATEAGRADEAAAVLDLIADYNRYDCVSTLRLRDWLRTLATENGITLRDADDPAALLDPTDLPGDDEDELAAALLAAAGDAPREDRTEDEQALAMLAAALGYHRREDKPFWWAHFDRLTAPPDEWAQSRDVLVAESVTVSRDWSKEGTQRSLRRELRITGELATGSSLAAGSGVWVVYDDVPRGLEVPPGAVRQVSGTSTVLSTSTDARGRDVLVVEEVLKKGLDPYDAVPMAVVPGSPVRTGPLEAAVREVASAVERDVLGGDERWPAQPALDLLRRLPPQLRDTDATPGGTLPVVGDGKGAYISAITDAVRALDGSYLAVQGPPGTGKTYVAARVIERLVGRGWRIGVVAPSHAVVEHLLDKIVDAGVPAHRVGKVPSGDAPHAWTAIPEKKQARFISEHRDHGFVVGGTAWDLTNTAKIGRGELDLLVVDEAGQFSVANTVAVSVAAHNLLLLGDPQQLPQVSQGTHPEPVDGSALGWAAHGHDALPAHLGYFLERTWRMHPDLCEPVSRLAYEGRLRSQESATAARSLEGMAPGVHVVSVEHRGSSVVSVEEADAVVAQVADLLGRAWTDGEGAEPRPLTEGDVLVVAAYNAQRAQVVAALARAGMPRVRVGTVDKFQGQEAPVVVLTMAASSAEDVPRGMGFLLSRNRVNVGVSRGQWAAVVVRSPALTDYLPTTPEALCELGAFIGLCSSAQPGATHH
ncbi:TM0106 family RecB-like putative nuclease [Sanguibacter sp. YZGR15]|uniref:TM0106 family RecB-like putative nuclease n=2 Tax=Sanguibacter suaedae TaxID=2795737 RepID=A0A934I7A6_9MICO|nr:TM0106 family RecB-like putative nuclease [Sanguibacter suaedae]